MLFCEKMRNTLPNVNGEESANAHGHVIINTDVKAFKAK
jgi:hypothetical protein